MKPQAMEKLIQKMNKNQRDFDYPYLDFTLSVGEDENSRLMGDRLCSNETFQVDLKIRVTGNMETGDMANFSYNIEVWSMTHRRLFERDPETAYILESESIWKYDIEHLIRMQGYEWRYSHTLYLTLPLDAPK